MALHERTQTERSYADRIRPGAVVGLVDAEVMQAGIDGPPRFLAQLGIHLGGLHGSKTKRQCSDQCQLDFSFHG